MSLPPRTFPAFTRQTLFDQLGDDVAFVTELAGIFQADCPGLMGGIEEAVARRDAAALAKSAHTVKGALATLGAREAADAALQLELIGRSGTVPTDGPSSAPEAYRVLKAAVQVVLPVLASFNHPD